uniref:probable ubiquitin-conjugating enzyme E2 25 n=1 Tax=Erigeron canadensis TaxID=72917 RepID=UPI001CB9242B
QAYSSIYGIYVNTSFYYYITETISVRVYESRIDLMRAVVIGQQGTPYHGGLFFFDVCFPSDYPNSPPLVHYDSGGLGINPNLYKCGHVRFNLPNTSGGQEPMWVHGTSTMLQLLVSIQNWILNANPLFNDFTYAITQGSPFGEQSSRLYNENTHIKSLKTMVYIMNKPPKNFEDFIAIHFRNGAREIVRVAFARKNCSVMYQDDLFSCLNPLYMAFKKMGAKDNQLSNWRKP